MEWWNQVGSAGDRKLTQEQAQDKAFEWIFLLAAYSFFNGVLKHKTPAQR